MKMYEIQITDGNKHIMNDEDLMKLDILYVVERDAKKDVKEMLKLYPTVKIEVIPKEVSFASLYIISKLRTWLQQSTMDTIKVTLDLVSNLNFTACYITLKYGDKLDLVEDKIFTLELGEFERAKELTRVQETLHNKPDGIYFSITYQSDAINLTPLTDDISKKIINSLE